MSLNLKVVILGLASASVALSQVVLPTDSYSQNFNNLAAGLPTGWTVSTSATSTTLGTVASFTSTATTWDSTAGAFRNISSNNIAFGSNSTVQNASTNRALGLRPVGANATEVTPFRTGALTLSIANTIGFKDFKLSLDLFQTNNTAGIQTYVIEYRVGDTGSFTQIGTNYSTIDTAGSFVDFNVRQISNVSLLPMDNQSSPVYIRVRGISTSGSTNLDTIALDNFVLTYAAIPEPSSFAVYGALSVLAFACARRQRRQRA